MTVLYRSHHRGLPATILLASVLLASLSACVPLLVAACVGTCALATATAAVVSTREPVAALTLQVEGLECGSCPEAVRGALMKLDGVRDAKVNASEKRVTVEYVPSKVTQQQLIDAVNELGYPAKVAAEAEKTARVADDHEGRHDENPVR